MRLDKFLCACRVGTRSEVKKYIKQKLVTVNGQTALKPEDKVDETADIICFRGKQLQYEAYRYYLLYKPAGCVTAVTDATHKTVMDLFPDDIRGGLSPVGRLDRDTEGLLIVTNDGEFTHHILSPSHHIPKTYLAELDYALPEDAVARFKEGLDIGDDELTLPAELELIEPYIHENGYVRHRALVTIHEGRYHQVKRMFHAVGCKVLYLKRLSIGNLTLCGLDPGDFRRLTEQEIAALKEL
ncbi:MAG: rRNA pseudouridine synthase [Agathobacter sp.]|nr:rRNA pseudouridine synthase [Agathobacter sp.]